MSSVDKTITCPHCGAALKRPKKATGIVCPKCDGFFIYNPPAEKTWSEKDGK